MQQNKNNTPLIVPHNQSHHQNTNNSPTILTQTQLIQIFDTLRSLSGQILIEQINNHYQAFTQYISYIKSKLQTYQQRESTKLNLIKQRDSHILKLKLEIKKIKKDFLLRKQGLVLQIDEQKTRIQQLKNQNNKDKEYNQHQNQQIVQDSDFTQIYQDSLITNIDNLSIFPHKLISQYKNMLQSKQTQIQNIKRLFKKFCDNKIQSDKYLGTKWQHEIQRVKYNIEIELDKEKQKTEEQYLVSLQKQRKSTLQQKQKVKQSIIRIRQLQQQLKLLQKQIITKQNNHLKEVNRFKNKISEIESKNQMLNSKYEMSLIKIEQQKSKLSQSLKQFQKFKQSVDEKQQKLKLSTSSQIQTTKKRYQQEKNKFISQSKNIHQQTVKKYQSQLQRKQRLLYQQFNEKCQNLSRQVQRTKQQNLQQYQKKMDKMIKQKEQLKRSHQKAMKQYRQQYQNLQIIFQKKQKQYEQSRSLQNNTINNLSLHIVNLKQQIQSLKQTIQIQEQQLFTNKSQLQSQKQKYESLEKINNDLNTQCNLLKTTHITVRTQINELRKYFIQQHDDLKAKHEKIIEQYKEKLKQMQTNCMTSQNMDMYVEQIKRLKANSSGMAMELKHSEVKLFTMSQISRQQRNKIEKLQIEQKKREERIGQSERKITMRYLNSCRNFNSDSEKKIVKQQDELVNLNQAKYLRVKSKRKTKSQFYQLSNLKHPRQQGEFARYKIQSQQNYRIVPSPRTASFQARSKTDYD